MVSPVQERWLFMTARSLPNETNIVEIGSFKGRSTCALAYGCRGTAKRVFAIDTFDGNEKDFFEKDFFSVFNRNLIDRGLNEYVTPLRGVSSEVGKRWDKPIHLLYIDGGHEYEDVLSDFQTFYPFVVLGGIVAFHDVHNFESNHGPIGFPGVLKVWREVAMPLLSEHGTCSTLAFGKKVDSRPGAADLVIHESAQEE